MAPLLQTPLKNNPAYREMTVEEFLEAELEGRAELDEGVVYMMAGGSRRHAAVSRNILFALEGKLRGSSCEPFGPDMTVRTGPTSLRLPDASVYCDLPDTDEGQLAKLLGDPRFIFEVLSPSTRKLDLDVKLPEYRGLAGVDAVIFVDPESERVRLVERTGSEAWTDQWLSHGEDVPLRSVGITLTAPEIFSRG
jgi:Uma2 family endonuclease